MIGRITGRIDYKATDHVLIDVRGVGYLVFVSDRTMAALPPAGEAVALYTDLLVQETNLQLFGFTSLVEKLMGVQGIGAKASLSILGALGADGVSRAIALGDWAALKAAKGVGPKTAQRLVIELKDKAPGVMAMAGGGDLSVDPGEVVEAAPQPAPALRKAKPQPAPNAAAQSEALSALGNLGYSPSDAASAVA
ncbi:MAG: Holliday junction branch migration protein RuvA, partial [Rhodobacterales bacterium]